MIVGGRFHPGRGPGLLGLPASTLLNQSVPLNDIWSKAESAPFVRICECQMDTCRIHLVKPIQEWLCWLYDER
jgi:hypothetical protein